MNKGSLIDRAHETVSNVDKLYQRISLHLHQARKNVLRSIDIEILTTYWNIGKEIIEEADAPARINSLK